MFFPSPFPMPMPIPFWNIIPKLPTEWWAFLGALLGGICAFIAAWMTIKNETRHWKEEQEKKERPIVEGYFEFLDDPAEIARWRPKYAGAVMYFVLGKIRIANVGFGLVHNVTIESQSHDV